MMRIMKLVLPVITACSLGVLALAAMLAVSATAVPQAGAQDAASDSIEVGPSGIPGVSLGAMFDEIEAPWTLTDEQNVVGTLAGRGLEFDGRTVGWVASTDGSGRIDLIAFVDPAYRTAADIGPGSTVAEARRAYGAARTVSLVPGSSGETIDFVNGPAQITFVTSLDGENQSGRYRDGRTFSLAPDRDGSIEALWLGCAAVDCTALLGGQAPASTDSVDTSAPTTLANTGVETPLVAFASLLVGGGCLTQAIARRSKPAC